MSQCRCPPCGLAHIHGHHSHSKAENYEVLLSDGYALTGDCGAVGTYDAQCAAGNASVVASSAVPERRWGYRDPVLLPADSHIQRSACTYVCCDPGAATAACSMCAGSGRARLEATHQGRTQGTSYRQSQPNAGRNDMYVQQGGYAQGQSGRAEQNGAPCRSPSCPDCGPQSQRVPSPRGIPDGQTSAPRSPRSGVLSPRTVDQSRAGGYSSGPNSAHYEQSAQQRAAQQSQQYQHNTQHHSTQQYQHRAQHGAGQQSGQYHQSGHHNHDAHNMSGQRQYETQQQGQHQHAQTGHHHHEAHSMSGQHQHAQTGHHHHEAHNMSGHHLHEIQHQSQHQHQQSGHRQYDAQQQGQHQHHQSGYHQQEMRHQSGQHHGPQYQPERLQHGTQQVGQQGAQYQSDEQQQTSQRQYGAQFGQQNQREVQYGQQNQREVQYGQHDHHEVQYGQQMQREVQYGQQNMYGAQDQRGAPSEYQVHYGQQAGQQSQYREQYGQQNQYREQAGQQTQYREQHGQEQQGYQMNQDYEVRPKAGVTVPRSSIGLGHPCGPISETVPRSAAPQEEQMHQCDLTPLMPAAHPPTQYVVNNADQDHYHRTSTYAASGVPMDLPTYSGARTWAERMQRGRT